jgi:enoyl-CoA hydratase/carnithine racemase
MYESRLFDGMIEGKPAKEGIRAFLEKKKPDFKQL